MKMDKLLEKVTALFEDAKKSADILGRAGSQVFKAARMEGRADAFLEVIRLIREDNQ